MYELTGPEALTRAQIAEQIGVGIGVDVKFERAAGTRRKRRCDRSWATRPPGIST